MKGVKMSIKIKQEILIHIQKRYKEAKFHSKSKILDEFVATTGYCRKYAISKLNQVKQGGVATPVTETLPRLYDEKKLIIKNTMKRLNKYYLLYGILRQMEFVDGFSQLQESV